MERAVAAFAIAFAVFYGFAYNYTITPFTYFPAINRVEPGVVAGGPDVGPPMFWYGWIAAGLLIGAVAGALAYFIPARGKVWGLLVWAVPLGGMLYMTWAGRHWFTFDIQNLPH
jgi:hypothetical protein